MGKTILDRIKVTPLEVKKLPARNFMRVLKKKELNTKFGSGFSIQPKFTQSAYFRFHNKSEIYNGLYFVGAGTHPGAGVPGVLSSAKVLDKIL